MASLKKIGFFWQDEQATLVEFEKNDPLRVVSVPLESKTNISSPFSSNFTEEIQVTALLRKVLQDNRIIGRNFCVSLPMKEIILRAFAIPVVNQEDVPNAIKFEAKKYLPIDIQDLNFVFYTSPFTDENKVRRLQVIFFAVRKESLDRYDRIFMQVNNSEVSYCEPWVVSLTKVLLFKKEIQPNDHIAFLILDKNIGRICFIDQGIPQFVREFSIGWASASEEFKDSVENLKLKIVNEVGNSFDFYARQFNAQMLGQVLVSARDTDQELLNDLETELKLKLKKFSPSAVMGALSAGHDMDAIYALGACITPPIPLLSRFNFFKERVPKSGLKDRVTEFFGTGKEVVFVFLICAMSLVGLSVFFQAQLKAAQHRYAQLSSKEGVYLNTPVESIQGELEQKSSKLASYKNIRIKSNVTDIVLKVASHLPVGTILKNLSINYGQGDSANAHVTVAMEGEVYKADSDEEMTAVNTIFSDFKKDKKLAKFVKAVTLVSLNLVKHDEQQVTNFVIHCS